MLRVSYPSGLRKFPAGSPERNLYIQLRTRIAEVAEGSVTSSEFGIDAKDVFLSPYTADDLGVENLFTADGKVTAEAANALRAIFNGFVTRDHFLPIFYCLLADSPYEFYWLDTQVWFQLGQPTVSFSRYTGNNDVILLRGSWKIALPISRDYARIPSDWDGTTILTDMDTDRYQWVKRATDNIDEIIAAAEELNDYEKMLYYREQIRELSTYNTTAEEELKSGARGYGDPWQLIWVFDGDPDTTVVCEGFAKAFNYLCDQGTAEAYSMEARGTMQIQGSNNAGNHMWNVVHIDGHSYLVDVTNDNSEHDLFLAGGDGNVVDGYEVRRGNGKLIYKYKTVTTPREEEDLEIPGYSYVKWRAATTETPGVQISSARTYPGYQVAIKVESCNGALPVEGLVVHTGMDEEETFDGNTVLLDIEQDVEMQVSAIIDGITTPCTEATTITVADEPESAFSLPTGASVESEAFAGIGAELVQIHDNQVAEGAFDPDVVLAVDAVDDWFDSGYLFVVRSSGEASDP